MSKYDTLSCFRSPLDRVIRVVEEKKPKLKFIDMREVREIANSCVYILNENFGKPNSTFSKRAGVVVGHHENKTIIATCLHSLKDSDRILHWGEDSVTSEDYSIKVLKRIPECDLAFLEIDGVFGEPAMLSSVRPGLNEDMVFVGGLIDNCTKGRIRPYNDAQDYLEKVNSKIRALVDPKFPEVSNFQNIGSLLSCYVFPSKLAEPGFSGGFVGVGSKEGIVCHGITLMSSRISQAIYVLPSTIIKAFYEEALAQVPAE